MPENNEFQLDISSIKGIFSNNGKITKTEFQAHQRLWLVTLNNSINGSYYAQVFAHQKPEYIHFAKFFETAKSFFGDITTVMTDWNLLPQIEGISVARISVLKRTGKIEKSVSHIQKLIDLYLEDNRELSVTTLNKYLLTVSESVRLNKEKNKMSDQNKTTIAQEELINELVQTYNLSPEQISFDGEKSEPIFDFEALCVLREKLTDFQSVDVSGVNLLSNGTEAEAVCVIVNGQGRIITASDFAQIGEPMPDGSTVQSSIQAKRLARARAMRTGIRAAGVNLVKAHKHFIETGELAAAEPVNARANITKEIHAIAGEIGFIKGSDRSEYENHIAQMFDGRHSSSDLNDIEIGQLRISLRAIRRATQRTIATAEKVAA